MELNMTKVLIAASAAAVLAAPYAGWAQEKAAVTVAQTEAVVKVVNIDRKARTVTFQGPREEWKPSTSEGSAELRPGQGRVFLQGPLRGSGGGGLAARREGVGFGGPHGTPGSKGGTPGGVVVNTATLSATVEAIDYANRQVALKGPKGNILALRVADDLQGFNDVKVGDSVTVAYTQALALEMLSDKPRAAPTPKKD